jgi:hypothetical protein
LHRPVVSSRHIVAALALVVALPAACTTHRLAEPAPASSTLTQLRRKQSLNRKLDILFMIDDSSSMAPLQTKLSQQLGNFMDALSDPATGELPDLHVAVVSSSFGGGAWGNVNQCQAGKHPGDDGGKFLQGPGSAGQGSCTMLHAGQKFLANRDGSGPNYDGDIRDAFKCMALLGDGGCGFESQFESVYYALAKGHQADDPDNGGFLRDDAILAVVMVTNEDDCSVASNSLLLDPSVNSVSDPAGLGALQSYRCNEFGHLCDGHPPPHDAPAGTVTLQKCVSAENDGKTDPAVRAPDGSPDPTMGHLWPTVSEFTAFLRSLKDDPDDVLVAALAGPTVDDDGQSLYRVTAQPNPAANGELDPVVDHSCTHPSQDPGMPEYADPAVRIKQWVDAFGKNGVFYPICADDFRLAMTGIANKLIERLDDTCIGGDIALVDPHDPAKGHNCEVTVPAASGATARRTLPECAPATGAPANAPCYRLTPNAGACTGAATTLLSICEDAACATAGATSIDTTIACVLK